MFEDQLRLLLESWKKAFGQYGNLKAKAEQRVVRWEKTTWERYSYTPFFFERFPGRGRVIKDGVTSPNYFLTYGFDEQGRIQVKREHQTRPASPSTFVEKLMAFPHPPDDIYSETFFQHEDERIESIEYSIAPYIPLDIQKIILENGRVSFFARFKLNGYTPLYGEKVKNPDGLYDWLGYNGRFKTAEEYSYEENRLRIISGYYEIPGLPPYTTQEQFAYTETGRLQSIDRFYEDGRKQLVYRKREKGQTFRALRQEVTQKLIDAIIQRVKQANIQEKVYCVELSYQKGVQHFPPNIVAAPESYRQQAIQSGDRWARASIYIPIPDKNWFFEIEDPETLERCQALEHEIHAGEKWDTATHILREIAAALTRYDWSGILKTTPDFVVFAIDQEMEGEDLVAILGSSVSQEQIQGWERKGWLI